MSEPSSWWDPDSRCLNPDCDIPWHGWAIAPAPLATVPESVAPIESVSVNVKKIRPKECGTAAVYYDGTEDCERQLQNWMTDSAVSGKDFGFPGDRDGLEVKPGSWMIRSTTGKFFVMSPAAFAATYDVLDD